jgi:hypothetical protein
VKFIVAQGTAGRLAKPPQDAILPYKIYLSIGIWMQVMKSFQRDGRRASMYRVLWRAPEVLNPAAPIDGKHAQA